MSLINSLRCIVWICFLFAYLNADAPTEQPILQESASQFTESKLGSPSVLNSNENIDSLHRYGSPSQLYLPPSAEYNPPTPAPTNTSSTSLLPRTGNDAPTASPPRPTYGIPTTPTSRSTSGVSTLSPPRSNYGISIEKSQRPTYDKPSITPAYLTPDNPAVLPPQLTYGVLTMSSSYPNYGGSIVPSHSAYGGPSGQSLRQTYLVPTETSQLTYDTSATPPFPAHGVYTIPSREVHGVPVLPLTHSSNNIFTPALRSTYLQQQQFSFNHGSPNLHQCYSADTGDYYIKFVDAGGLKDIGLDQNYVANVGNQGYHYQKRFQY